MSSNQKIAIITGVTGQDGAYLAELLLNKDYKVYGTFRRSSTNNFWRIKALGIDKHPNLCLIEVDLTDLSSLINLLKKCNPNEFYNLAAQSFVASSFEQPTTTATITALGVLNILEAIKIVDSSIRFYQASTSEMFGKVQNVPQDETTPFYPRSPYGVAKLYAHWITVNYRESYNIFACSGILFNHESPLRGKEFVTRKITDTLSRIKLGQNDILELGNIDAKRDWGYAKEYVEGMWKMLQQDMPDTYVLATQRTESIRYFTELAAQISEIDLIWEGKEQDELGIEKSSGKIIVKINPKFYRPAEVELLIGDATKAKEHLDWEPQTKLEKLCEIMVKADFIRNKKLKVVLNNRYEFN